MKRWIKGSTASAEMSEAIFNAWEKSLEQADLQEEDIHTLTYAEVKDFEKILERNLKDNQVDLSFKSMFLPSVGNGLAIQGMKVGGNTGAIANSLIRGCNKLAWTPLYDQSEASDYLDNAPAIYTEDKYGYCIPSSKSKALSLIGAGNKTQYSGYGSQSYIDETKVTVYEDYFGNIKVDRSTLRYD